MFVRKELIANRPPPDPDAGRFKNFSLAQWVVLVILDLVFRFAVFALVPYLLYFFWKLSALHLVLLIPITCLVSLFRPRTTAALFAILVPTNVLYLGTVILSVVRTNAESWMGNCSRVPLGTGCEQWVNGPTWSYVLETTMLFLPLLVINVLPFVAVFIYLRIRAGRNLGSRSA